MSPGDLREKSLLIARVIKLEWDQKFKKKRFRVRGDFDYAVLLTLISTISCITRYLTQRRSFALQTLARARPQGSSIK